MPIDPNVDAVYTLVLKFSEVYFDQPGEKVFNVKVGEHFIQRDLDPFERAYGKYMPYDLFQEITVKGGKVQIDGKGVRGAIK